MTVAQKLYSGRKLLMYKYPNSRVSDELRKVRVTKVTPMRDGKTIIAYRYGIFTDQMELEEFKKNIQAAA